MTTNPPQRSLLGLRTPQLIRASLFWVGILILIAAFASPQLRSLFLDHQILSALIFVLAGLVVVPSRWWPLAAVIALAAYAVARVATRLKEAAVLLPITYIDVASAIRNPDIPLRAVGYEGSVAPVAVAAGLLLLFALVVGIRAFGRPPIIRAAMLIVESAALVAVSLATLERAGRDLNGSLQTRFPDVALELWEPLGQRQLAFRVGPLEYLAFTHAFGSEGWAAPDKRPEGPLPAAAIRRAAAKYISPAGRAPNIVVLHAESTFDPNVVFNLTRPAASPLWSPGPQTRSLGPLWVNVVGGGTHVTEFEILTGADARQFGYWGFYSHLTLAPRLQTAFPKYLASRGYRTFASYTASPEWLGAGKAFRAYGFQKVFFQDELKLRGDWSETDPYLVSRVIAKGALQPSRQPQLVYISTLENHGPHRCEHFRSRAEFVTTFKGNASFAQDCSLNEYIRRARSTAQAMAILRDRLSKLEAATGRPFVLLVYGDHQPWSFTDGNYSVAGGEMNSGNVASFSRFRRGNSQNLTFYQIQSSIRGVVPPRFPEAIPVSLLPTLLSGYVARDASDLYLPVNLLALESCGGPAGACRLREDFEQWAVHHLFVRPEAGIR